MRSACIGFKVLASVAIYFNFGKIKGGSSRRVWHLTSIMHLDGGAGHSGHGGAHRFPFVLEEDPKKLGRRLFPLP